LKGEATEFTLPVASFDILSANQFRRKRFATRPMKSFSTPFGIPQPKRAVAAEPHRIISIRVVWPFIHKPSKLNSHPRKLFKLHGRRFLNVLRNIIAVITSFEAGFPTDLEPKHIPGPLMNQIKY